MKRELVTSLKRDMPRLTKDDGYPAREFCSTCGNWGWVRNLGDGKAICKKCDSPES